MMIQTEMKSGRVHRQELAHKIVDISCKFLGYTKPELCGRNRLQPLCSYRQIIMALTHELSGLTLGETGLLFNKRDHGTVFHAVAMVHTGKEDKKSIYSEYDSIRGKLLLDLRDELAEKFKA